MGESMLINHYGSSFTPTSAVLSGLPMDSVTAACIPSAGSQMHSRQHAHAHAHAYHSEEQLASFALEAIGNNDWHNYYNNCSNVNVPNSSTVTLHHQPPHLPQATNLEPTQPKPKRYRRRKAGDGPPKKRERHPDTWTRVVKSKDYNTGKIRKFNGEIRSRRVRGVCSDPVKCRIKCTTKISHAQQEELNNNFWELGSFQKRREYLASHVFRFEKNRARVMYRISQRNRQYTYKYYITMNDERINVCKSFFLNTYDVSDRMVHDGSTSMIIPGMCTPKRQPKDLITDDQRNVAKFHIKKYLIGTVSRNPKIKQKEPHLTVSEMYKHYKNWFIDRNYEECVRVGKPLYRKIFLQGIKMGFHVNGKLPKGLDRSDDEEQSETAADASTENATNNKNNESNQDDMDLLDSDFEGDANDDASSDDNFSFQNGKSGGGKAKNADKAARNSKAHFDESFFKEQTDLGRMTLRSTGRKKAKSRKSSTPKRIVQTPKNSAKLPESNTDNAQSNIDTAQTNPDNASTNAENPTEAESLVHSFQIGDPPLGTQSNSNHRSGDNSGDDDEDFILPIPECSMIVNSNPIIPVTSTPIHISNIPNTKRARAVRGICTWPDKCRQQCSTKISPVLQHTINTYFWGLGSIPRRHTYLVSHVHRYEKKTTTTNLSQRDRKYSYQYYLDNMSEKVQVCQSFFINTLGISASMVHEAYSGSSVNYVPDTRKNRVPVNKTKPQSIELVKCHVQFYLGNHVELLLGGPKKEDNVNVTEMYRQYEEWFKDCNHTENLKVKQHMYRKIYHENFAHGPGAASKSGSDATGAAANDKRPTVISIRGGSP